MTLELQIECMPPWRKTAEFIICTRLSLTIWGQYCKFEVIRKRKRKCHKGIRQKWTWTHFLAKIESFFCFVFLKWLITRHLVKYQHFTWNRKRLLSIKTSQSASKWGLVIKEESQPHFVQHNLFYASFTTSHTCWVFTC